MRVLAFVLDSFFNVGLKMIHSGTFLTPSISSTQSSSRAARCSSTAYSAEAGLPYRFEHVNIIILMSGIKIYI